VNIVGEDLVINYRHVTVPIYKIRQVPNTSNPAYPYPIKTEPCSQ